MSHLKVGAIVLDCPDPLALAEFYAQVLGWKVDDDSDANWATLRDPDGGTNLAFQCDEDHRPSTWPSRELPQMLHLDVTVADLDAEHERVVGIGAKALSQRYRGFRVYADPAGHPFCLCLN